MSIKPFLNLFQIPWESEMVDVTSIDGLPPSVMDLLRVFLAATTRGEQVSLLLESGIQEQGYHQQILVC